MSLSQVPLPSVINTRGGDAIYGPGSDGNVTITGTVVLDRDMYYNNLTLLSDAQLDTNGFRVFVKGNLHMADPTSVIGRLSNTTSVGTILGGAPPGIKASDTLGGDGGLNPGENFFGEAEFYNFSQAIAGYKFDAVANTLRFLMGGSGGASGSYGESGSSGYIISEPGAGESGSVGFPGTRPGFEYTVGASGGMGYSGSPGSPGTPGIPGLGGTGGEGGSGGAGGGVVIISAKNVTGYGVIRADGLAGSPGNPGALGGEDIPGINGEPGSPGAPAPDFYSSSYTYVVNYAYNYNVIYNFTNEPTPVSEYQAYDSPVLEYSAYNVTFYNPVTYYYYYQFQSYTGFVPAMTFYGINYNPRTSTYNPRFVTYNAGVALTYNPRNANYNSRTPGPASVRWRTSNLANYNPGTGAVYTTRNAVFSQGFLVSWNAGTILNYNSYVQPSYNFVGYNVNNLNASQGGNVASSYTVPDAYYYTTAYNVFTYDAPGNPATGYYEAFEPEGFAVEPEVYHVGGAGGAGGLGGAGGIASSGLPGSPGSSGYSGGGGVVLFISGSDVPEEIEVRAAAGIGDGGLATSGTVIIIKNEGEQ